MPAGRDPHRPSLDPESEEYKRLWDQGLRPCIIWLPDTTDPEIREQIRREAQSIARCPHEEEDMAWVESVSILFDECDQDSGQTLQ